MRRIPALPALVLAAAAVLVGASSAPSLLPAALAAVSVALGLMPFRREDGRLTLERVPQAVLFLAADPAEALVISMACSAAAAALGDLRTGRPTRLRFLPAELAAPVPAFLLAFGSAPGSPALSMILPLLEAGDLLAQAVPGRWRILRGAHLWLFKLFAEAPLWVLLRMTATGGAAEGSLLLMAPVLTMSVILWLRLRSLSRYRFLVAETALQNRLAEELSNSSSPVAFMELLDAFFGVPRGGCAMLSRHSSGREWLCWTGEGQTAVPEGSVEPPPSWGGISSMGLSGREGTAAGLSRERDWFLFVPAGFALAEMESPLRNNLLSIVSHAWRAVGHSTAIDEAFIAAAMMLARLADSKDDYTHGHSVRVSRLCRKLGREMGLPDHMVRTLGVGALLHDLGKVAIPLEILTKRGLLTREERMVIERHPVEGERILDALSGYEEVRGIVRSHHERLDGNGYPAGLSGRAIPLLARIVAVADTFDAITSRRSYRADSDERTALHAIRAGSGTQFDARVVEAFGRVLAGEGVIGPDE